MTNQIAPFAIVTTSNEDEYLFWKAWKVVENFFHIIKFLVASYIYLLTVIMAWRESSEISLQLSTVNYFHKKLYLRCLVGLCLVSGSIFNSGYAFTSWVWWIKLPWNLWKKMYIVIEVCGVKNSFYDSKCFVVTEKGIKYWLTKVWMFFIFRWFWSDS